MDRRLIVTAVCLSVLGCDADNLVDDPVDPAAHHETLKKLPPPDGETPALKPFDGEGAKAAVDVSGLPHPDKPFPTPAQAKASCEASCNAEARSDDDRATCRLDCTKTKPDRPAQVMRRFLDCSASCDPQDQACVTTCGDAVRTAGRAELAYDPFCASVCLDTLPRCRGECLAPSHDDAATCRLHCEQDGARCLRSCTARAQAADKAAATPHTPRQLADAARALGDDDAAARAKQLIDDAARDLGVMLVDVRKAKGDPKVVAGIEERLSGLAHRLGEGVIRSSGELDPDHRAALDAYGDTKLTVPLRNLMKEVAAARAPK